MSKTICAECGADQSQCPCCEGQGQHWNGPCLACEEHGQVPMVVSALCPRPAPPRSAPVPEKCRAKDCDRCFGLVVEGGLCCCDCARCREAYGLDPAPAPTPREEFEPIPGHGHECGQCGQETFILCDRDTALFQMQEAAKDVGERLDKATAALELARPALSWAHNELTKRGFICDGDCEICLAIAALEGK